MGIKGFIGIDEETSPVAKVFADPKKSKKGKKTVGKQKAGKRKYSCEVCGLSEARILSPKMPVYGGGRKGILIWGEGPGADEDKEGRQFFGVSGRLLNRTLDTYGIDMDVDCWLTNAIDCHIPGNKKPTLVQLRCCYEQKAKLLKELKPVVILLLGDYALESFYRCSAERNWMDLGVASLRGKVIPEHSVGAWVAHSYHPAYILRGNEDKEHIFEKDVGTIIHFKKRPHASRDMKWKAITDHEEALEIIEHLHKSGSPIVFDYETSSYRYHEGIHKIYCIGLQALDEGVGYVIPLEKTNIESGALYWKPKQLESIKKALRDLMSDEAVPKVAHHLTHEHKCTHFFLGVDTKGWWWDTKLGNRVQDETRGVNRLKIMSYFRFGKPDYSFPSAIIGAEPKHLNKLDGESFEKVAEYNAQDLANSVRLCKIQRKEVEAKKLTRAYELLHRGSESFAYMEREGIRLDMFLLHKYKAEWTEEFNQLRENVLLSKEGVQFENRKGRSIEYKKQISRDDLTTVLVDIMGLPKSSTMDENYLSNLADKCDFLQYELKARKTLKRLGFLNNWLELQVDGFLYPTFNLDIARSYRSSSTEPNFQNVPKRDQEGAFIRKLVIPREGHVILEVDYSGMEVRILACWSKDPTLLDFVISGYDMHAHWATEIYGAAEGQIDKVLWKRLRYGAKNGFVFPNFYGSYWKNTAGNLWEYLPVDVRKDWDLDRWERHVHACETKFWKMFSGVRKRQEEAVEQYKQLGYMEMIGWGFRRHGYLNRNTIFNSHIQGPAYHCLMDVINHLVPLKLKERWATRMPGQIHDAIFFDAAEKERGHVIEAVTEELVVNVRRRNKWVIVPLEVEWEVGKNNWGEMQKLSV